MQDDLKKGDFVAVLPDEEQYARQPWIAQCVDEPRDDTVTVKWLKGALTRPWIPDRHYNPTEINVKTIINRVEFTPTQKLTKSSLQVIKDALGHLMYLYTSILML